MATTTSTLVLVSWPGGALTCRRLAPPAGLLGGIGRRVSSLLWGSMQAAGAEEVRDQSAVRLSGRTHWGSELYILMQQTFLYFLFFDTFPIGFIFF